MKDLWKPKKRAGQVGGKAKDGRFSLPVILLSVLLALALWFHVQDAEAPDYKKTFVGVPVEIQSLSSSFSVIQGGDSRVDITLVGKRSDLNKLKSSDLEAYLDLRDVTQSGDYQMEISVMAPENTELIECFPKAASLKIDQTISVSVPVLVEMGEYTVQNQVGVEAVPGVDEITVKGPKSILETAACAKVKTGKLGEITESFESNLDYVLYDKSGEPITSRYVITPEKNVLVKFIVYKTKSVSLTLATERGFWKEEDMRVTIAPETILVKGEPALIDSLESIPALKVDETQVDTNRYSVTLSSDKLLLPDGVSLAETLGDIKVSLVLLDNVSRTLKMRMDSTHVAVTPPEGNLSYQFASPSLSFQIRGKSESVSSASVDDFYLNIDLSDVTSPGAYEVPVQIVQTSATEGKYYPVGTYQIKVTVS